MKSYTVRDIPDDQYKTLRIIAAESETSINKAILQAIKDLVLKGNGNRARSFFHERET